MSEIGNVLRAAREAAGLSLSTMARRTHFSKPYLGLVETGKRPATPDVVKTYERALGVGGLGDNVDRRGFLTVTTVAAVNAKLAGELTASVAGADPNPLATVQTSYGTDLAVSSIVDRASVRCLHRWMTDGDEPILRVNAAGILAKLPGQEWAHDVVTMLGRDVAARDRNLTAVVARVCALDWPTAAGLVGDPRGFPQPVLAAGRFAREAVNPRDAGARWCSAVMLQRLSPMLGGSACS